MKIVLQKARVKLLQMHYSAGVGHIGGNFSCIDTLITLYHSIMTPDDRFVLSKGHSAGALYVALWSVGILSDLDLETFCQDGTTLSGHPSREVPGVLFSTGSLGHGASLSSGLALAARHQGSSRRIFCLCSDGEWQEGSNWEALIFSVHNRLENLAIMVDQNGWQGFGRTGDVASMFDLCSRFESFGAKTVSVDGHDLHAIAAALRIREPGKPTVIVLRTRKGCGLHFENCLESHYLPLTRDQYVAACAAISSEVLS